MTALALFNALFAPWKAKRMELNRKRLTRLRRSPFISANDVRRREHGGYGERYAGFL